MAMAPGLGQQGLVSRVEISVACRKLADMDLTSKSDPMCVLMMCPPGTRNYREQDRTEMLKDTLNPDFQHKFVVDFHFEEHQKVMFCLYDIDSHSTQLSDHDFLGQFESTIGELVSRRRVEAPLAKSPRRDSTIIITCIELQHCKEILQMQLCGSQLDKKDFLGKSDPYFEVSKPLTPVVDSSSSDLLRAQWTLVYRSAVVRKNLNPTWQPTQLKLSQMCNGNKSLILRWDCIDWNKRMKHSHIGTFYASVADILREYENSNSRGATSGAGARFQLLSRRKKPAGYLVFNRLELLIEDSFVDYIQGGCELLFTVGIDFTASNGNPATPQSLHYIDPSGRLNQYELAITSVGEIVQDYDFRRAFPSFGFGARVPPRGDVNHCFPLTFNDSNPYCAGLAGLLQAYRSCLRSVTLYGPTNFSPIIRHVMQLAQANQSGKQYFVLLIITDGIITDFYETKLSIIEASRLPMSIIIVGVGREDFSAMEELDADNKRLQIGGMIAEADIVQFVPLRDFFRADNPNELSKSALTKAVLEELPDQLCQWMRKRGIKAGPPVERSQPVLQQPQQQLVGPPAFDPMLAAPMLNASAPPPYYDNNVQRSGFRLASRI
ncbi:hypothetical protein BOX15_Mlig006534g5 [Macrostomum lignano]|uniref:C2 domain-containing protein n=1 Tax=Macrostomum lignano TaxID=282301 RepID=A0A267DFW5_9PLAT|nr:hypothetical protein BOX15_Mlig006534g5 [Macrostomum lignano]